jgi:hypothetical protein
MSNDAHIDINMYDEPSFSLARPSALEAVNARLLRENVKLFQDNTALFKDNYRLRRRNECLSSCSMFGVGAAVVLVFVVVIVLRQLIVQ